MASRQSCSRGLRDRFPRGKTVRMTRITKIAGALVLGALAAGCGTTFQVAPAPPPASMPPTQFPAGKRIVRDSAELVLPDGTRVTPDVRGGFELPNGDYVTRAPDGALVLPTGARCVPQQGGYLCP